MKACATTSTPPVDRTCRLQGVHPLEHLVVFNGLQVLKVGVDTLDHKQINLRQLYVSLLLCQMVFVFRWHLLHTTESRCLMQFWFSSSSLSISIHSPLQVVFTVTEVRHAVVKLGKSTSAKHSIVAGSLKL